MIGSTSYASNKVHKALFTPKVGSNCDDSFVIIRACQPNVEVPRYSDCLTEKSSLNTNQRHTVDGCFERMFGYPWGTRFEILDGKEDEDGKDGKKESEEQINNGEYNVHYDPEDPYDQRDTLENPLRRGPIKVKREVAELLCGMLGSKAAARILLQSKEAPYLETSAKGSNLFTARPTVRQSPSVACLSSSTTFHSILNQNDINQTNNTNNTNNTNHTNNTNIYSYMTSSKRKREETPLASTATQNTQSLSTLSTGGNTVSLLSSSSIQTGTSLPPRTSNKTTNSASGSGVDALLLKMATEGQKVSTIAKTNIDWELFKSEHAELGEKLEQHVESTGSYLKRQEFLTRVDHRQFWNERQERELERTRRAN